MFHILQRYELFLAAIFSAFLLLLPYGLFFGPLFYTLVLIAIYLRDTRNLLRSIRNEWLGYQNQMLKLAKEGSQPPTYQHSEGVPGEASGV